MQALNPTERTKQAFLQLEFAIKLMSYVELNKVDKATFDTDTVVLLSRDSLSFSESSFNSYDDLILAAQNNYQIALGFSAITLESALQDAGLHNNPSDVSPRGQLRTLVYMIRNAFAHDMMIPRWDVKPKYQRVLNVTLASHTVCVDLRVLNGKPFDDGDIGGIGTYYEIRDAVLNLVTAARIPASTADDQPSKEDTIY